jgi:uncharacterized protein
MEIHRPQLFGLLAGLFLAAGLCLASLILANAWTRLYESQVISITGSARRNVTSDLVIWRARFSVQADTLMAAQQRLTEDRAKVQAWLRLHAIQDFQLQPVQIADVRSRGNRDDDTTAKLIGYRISQNVEVVSDKVDQVPRIASDSTALLEQGVAFVSEQMDFIYTKAGEAKIELMAEATKDARARAEQIAAQGGRKVKELRSARMGVVQINPRYSTATSWEGNNDTSSLEKTMITTVNATFALR